MPDTTSGLWNAGDVYRRIALGSWVSATPETVTISADPAPSATVSTYSGYIVFTFTSSGTLNVGSGQPGVADALVVAGGGSGSGSFTYPRAVPTPYFVGSGAGGTGGKVYAIPGTTITADSSIPVVVGGAGSNSTFGPLSSASGSSVGGGGARGYPFPSPSLETATTLSGANGGTGAVNSYRTGSNQNYGGGGGSGGFNWYQGNAPGSSGGAGGGGSGGGVSFEVGAPGGNGTVNTGGAGGSGGYSRTGSSSSPGSAGTGGSGIVVIRFPDTQFST